MKRGQFDVCISASEGEAVWELVTGDGEQQENLAMRSGEIPDELDVVIGKRLWMKLLSIARKYEKENL